MQKKDYYAILNITRDATEEDIKKSYRRLALEYHPDTNEGNAETEERFKEINEAYSVLGDQEKRRQYDTFGRINEYETGPFGATYPNAQRYQRGFNCRGRGMGMWRAFGRKGRGMGRNFKGFSSPERESLSGNSRRSIHSIPLTSAEARLGTEKEVLLTVNQTIQKINVRTPPGLKDKAMLFMKGEDLGQGMRDMYFQIKIISE